VSDSSEHTRARTGTNERRPDAISNDKKSLEVDPKNANANTFLRLLGHP
jgi:hypothetical protein